MLRTITALFILFYTTFAFSEVFLFSVKKLTTINDAASCFEKISHIAQLIDEKVTVIEHACEQNLHRQDLLDGYIQYESSAKLQTFDSNMQPGVEVPGYFSSLDACNIDLGTATDAFKKVTGARPDLAYCFDDGVFADKTPYRHRFLSFDPVEIQALWFKQNLFGTLLGYTKESFLTQLKNNTKNYDLDIFTFGLRPSAAWSEIIFAGFSKQRKRLKNWSDTTFDGPKQCLEAAKKIQIAFATQQLRPAAVFCTKNHLKAYHLNIWGLLDKDDKDISFRIHPLKKSFATLSTCEAKSSGLNSEHIGQFCAKDKNGRIRNFLILKVKRVEL